MIFKEKLSALKEWYVNTRDGVKKFIYTQIAAYVVLFISLYNQAPKIFVLLGLVSTLIIPFALVIKVLTDNPLYFSLKDEAWGKAVIAVITGVYCTLSAIWASSEINSIFLVSASNLPWATTILTIVYFFKNVVVAFIGGYLALIFMYSIFWIADVMVFSFNGVYDCVKRIVAGILLVVGLGLAIGTAGTITQNGNFFAKYVAVKADFNTGHRCKGNKFNNIDGVLFLSNGSVLIAKPIKNKTGWPDWSFQDSPCEM